MNKIKILLLSALLSTTAIQAQDSIRIAFNNSNYADKSISTADLVGLTYYENSNAPVLAAGDALPDRIKLDADAQIFSHLLEVTGWAARMRNYYDVAYETYYKQNSAPVQANYALTYNPERRRLGYTALIETDQILENLWGITLNESEGNVTNWESVMTTISQKCSEYYPDANSSDLQSEDNAVNRFVSYHLIGATIPYNKFVVHYTEMGYNYNNESQLAINAWEYRETMGKQRWLMKFTEGATTEGIRINRCSSYNLTNYREASVSLPGIKIVEPTNDYLTINGCYYFIDSPLIYYSDIPNRVLNERLRFDAASLFPEMTTNGLRSCFTKGYGQNLNIPSSDFQYFENLTASERTKVSYFPGYKSGWNDYQGDEFCVSGTYDVTIRLPRVPYTGTYEIRMGTSLNTRGGVAQIQFGTDANNMQVQGLPIDFRQTAASQGWVADTDEATNLLNDLCFRQNGYLKAPLYYSASPSSQSVRNSNTTVRKILCTVVMSADEDCYLRIKNLLDVECSLVVDYIELVPRSVYDGVEGEDQW